MKKLLIIILLASMKLFAQDTTKVLNLSLQARVIEYLAPFMADPNATENFKIFLKWRATIQVTRVTNNTNVVTDTIETILLASIYNQALSAPEGMGVGALMKAQIATKRAANSYLNKLCTDYEQGWLGSLVERRARGRRLLLGK